MQERAFGFFLLPGVDQKNINNYREHFVPPYAIDPAILHATRFLLATRSMPHLHDMD